MSETSPPLPGAPRFPLTPEQRAAVETAGRDIYVTAAAGSGKTAVLTERVFRLISEAGPEGRSPIQLERLLVITFTRKAAQEMRERIERRIRAGLEEHPDSPALRAALDSLPRSHIMTIDAFCDRLVRRHFHLAGVSPAVRLADEEEELEIVHTATREVFEASAAGKDGLEPGIFADLLRSTPPSQGGLLESLKIRVDRLRSYVSSLEDGPGWMVAARRMLEARRDAATLNDIPDREQVEETFRQELAEIAETLRMLWEQATGIVSDPADIPCGRNWKVAIARIERAAHPGPINIRDGFAGLWREMRDWFASDDAALALTGLHTKRSCGTEIYNSPLKDLLKKFTGNFAQWRETWFDHDEEQMLEAERLAGAQGLALLELAEAVEQRAQAIKRRRSLMSFGDMQRKALDLLTENGGPSAVACDYRDFFESVLVDEYQDISPLQDALIRRLSRPADPSSGTEGNLFVVGDVKQSIYRFRQAEPLLFRTRLEHGRAPKSDDLPLTLSLSTNFRSQAGILNAVNDLFRGLMDRRIGDVEMKGDALLNPGRLVDPSTEGPRVELQWLDPAEMAQADETADDDETNGAEDTGDLAELKGIEAEARWIATRIRELERGDPSTWIPDPEAPGGMRPIRPSDCAILVRSLSRSEDVWITELSRWDINVRTAGGESLWKSVEGEDLLAALRLVDQPFDDLALATVLRSPLGGFTDDDLLRLRMASGSGPFWNAMWNAAGRPLSGLEHPSAETPPDPNAPKTPLDEALRERLRTFFLRLDHWRDLALTRPAEAVLDTILRDTHYEAHVLGGRHPDAGMRNIEELRLRMRARERQGNQGSGLSDFLRALQSGGGRPQDQEDESLRLDPGAIQLMTVHKSKGLEFPVVFLARMGQRYNTDHRSGALLFSPEGTMALAAVDPRRKVRLEPPSLVALHSREARALRGEELRLLYVAMTRARERLILVASTPGLRHQREPGYSLLELGELAPAFARVRASSPAAMVGPRIYALNRQASQPWLRIHESSAVTAPPAAVDLKLLREALADSSPSADMKWHDALTQCGNPEVVSDSAAKGATQPPLLASAASDATSTPLKKRPSMLMRGHARPGETDLALDDNPFESLLFDEDEMRPVVWNRAPASSDRPRFSLKDEDESLGAVDRGQLAHAFLQHLDLRGALDEAGLRNQAERLFELGLLGVKDPASLDQIPFEGIAAFFDSPVGKMLAARPGSVTRELPFAHWMPVSEFSRRFDALEKADPDRLITVQGVIDCVVDEGERITLIDYKTNTIRGSKDIDRLKQQYRPQLQLYAEALQASWNLPELPGTWIVFLRTGQAEPMNPLFITA